MTGSTFKRCYCTNPATGKPLGQRCPQLKRRNNTWSATHGTWWFQVELPRRSDNSRRQARQGGFATVTEAENQIDKIKALIGLADRRDTQTRTKIGDLIEHVNHVKEPLPTPKETQQRIIGGTAAFTEIPTVGPWLDYWLGSRKKVRKGTRRSYESHIRLWLKPHLGHHRLDHMTVDHVRDMFDAMEARNAEIEAARASDDPDVRASVTGMRIMKAATMHRYRATLRAALNAAIPKYITINVAKLVELPSGKRPKALLWTEERVQRWRETGVKPSPVMVWTPQQFGHFLDHCRNDPLHPLLHTIGHRGLRRGEGCGLPWSETSLKHKTLTVSAQLVQLGWAIEFGEPKSEASGRVVPLDDYSVEVLRAHKERQDHNRLLLGDAWVDSGLVFTNPDGSPLHPGKVSDRFQILVAESGLPPIRLHDLRHGAATLALAAGADLKVVQELLGHSTIAITGDIYAHVLPELAREIAEKAANLVPRRSPTTQEPGWSTPINPSTTTPGTKTENLQVNHTEHKPLFLAA